MQHSLSLKDPGQCSKGQSKIHCIMTHNTSLHTDILSMNVSWLLEDLELFENQFNILESMIFTIAICITFFMAIIVHRSFYRLMKRLPGRDINQIIFPYMVKLEAKSLWISHMVKIFMEQKNWNLGWFWAGWQYWKKYLSQLRVFFHVFIGNCFYNFFKNIVASALKSHKKWR